MTASSHPTLHGGDAPAVDPSDPNAAPDEDPIPDNGDPGATNDPEVDPGTPATGPLAQMLVGDWWSFDDIGNCIEFRDWYSFAADGTVVNREIDHNACSGNRLTGKTSGHYTIEGHALEITLDGIGSELPFEMTMPTLDIAQRVETMTVAIGGLPAMGVTEAKTFLDGHAYVSSDGVHFESQHSVVMTAASGELAYEEKAALSIELNPGLPLVLGAHTHVKVHASLALFDAVDTTPAASDEISYEYPATIQEAHDWLQILPDAVGELTGQAAVDAWNAVLAGQGVTSSAHLEWALRMLDYPAQSFRADDPSLLGTTLPEYGRMQWSPTPPPVL